MMLTHLKLFFLQNILFILGNTISFNGRDRGGGGVKPFEKIKKKLFFFLKKKIIKKKKMGDLKTSPPPPPNVK